MPIRPSRWPLPAVPIAVALAALTACMGPAPAPTPIATTKPVLENEEQALAAVAETYTEYLRLSNLILTEGGVDVGRIDAVVGDELGVFERESLGELATAGKTLVGAPTLTSVKIREWYSSPDAAGVLASANACIDLSGVQVFDAAGVSTVREDRPTTRTWAMDVGPAENEVSGLVILSLEVVSEGPSCEAW